MAAKRRRPRPATRPGPRTGPSKAPTKAPSKAPAGSEKTASPPAGRAPTKRGDLIHLGLLLAALALAYVLPFELLVLSYAILGPIHYLTEISWLHDRKYFLPHRGLAVLLSLVALAAMFMADPFWLGILVSFSFVVCAVLANAPTPRVMAGVLAAAAGVFALLSWISAPFALAWALLPGLIHVSVFTLVFMTVGAFKSGSRTQFGLVGAYLVALGVILVFPPLRPR